VFGNACEQRSSHFDLNKCLEGRRGKPPAPSRWVDPVGEFSLTLTGEAGDHSGQAAFVIDRTHRHVKIIPYALVMRIELRTVRGVGPGEGRHRNSKWVSLPLKELIKIGILEHTQHHTHTINLWVATDKTAWSGRASARPPACQTVARAAVCCSMGLAPG
jgi:hypothetical protein